MTKVLPVLNLMKEIFKDSSIKTFNDEHDVYFFQVSPIPFHLLTVRVSANYKSEMRDFYFRITKASIEPDPAQITHSAVIYAGKLPIEEEGEVDIDLLDSLLRNWKCIAAR